MRVVALSTKDNPFNPITQFDDWYRFDMDKNYSSCSYLARITQTLENKGSLHDSEIIEAAIDEIVQYDPFNRYIKVVEEVESKDDESNKVNEMEEAINKSLPEMETT